ncbi:hypothetical protein ACFQE1_01350 [Halobium palmae]|uniref:MFS transporter n=1 Tax=Halobium palmae TaxID=1776492 RepID=A0ABD5RV80_9EURY
MTAATVSRWARRYVLISVLFLVTWQIAVVSGIPRHTEVVLGVFGFILHMIFGKAYSLVPTYFDRTLAFPRAPAVQFPFVVVGTGGLVGASLRIGPPWLGAVGALLWSLGVGVFLVALLWTVRSNLTGRQTATGETNVERRPVDRLANGFVPIAFLYLTAGTYETLAIHTGLPPLFDGYSPRVTHLLAAGTAGVMLFALGFRLLPRFLVAAPPRPLVAVVLVTGALGPVVLATHMGSGSWFQLGALVEAMAVTGFAIGVGTLFVRSNRRRVGFYGVLAGAISGVIGVGIGLSFAFGHQSPALVIAHLRLNLLGFLGFSIIGITYQFYPPAVGSLPGASDRTAFVSLASLTSGLFIQVIGLSTHHSLVTMIGQVATLGGTLLYAFLIGAVFTTR